MVRINMGQLVMALVFAAALLHGTNADDITVGGNTGWTQPSDPNFYSSWASSNTFEVGDNLVFNFGNSHNVAIVDKAGYDGCSTSNAQRVITNGPANISLDAAGAHYFICGVPGHCSSGQKLSINVVADNDTPPSPSGTTSPPGTTSSPPPPPGTTTSPPSAASSRGVAFTVVLMSIAVALFC